MKKGTFFGRAVSLFFALVMCVGLILPETVQASPVYDQGRAKQTLFVMGIVSEAQANAGSTKTVSRQQFAKLLVKTSEYCGRVGGPVKTAVYQDVRKNNAYAAYIKLASEQGWMKGNLSGKFRPKKAVTAQEAANAVIALLGYEDSDFQGSKASARWAFYKSKSLNANITRGKSDAMTYQDVINLLYNTLVAKTKGGSVYAQTLGYTLDANGDVDYLALIDKGLAGPLIAVGDWSSRLPFALSEAAVYIGGSRRMASAINTYDVVYYHERTKTVYVFQERVTGKLDAVQPSTIAPASVTVGGISYTLSGQEVSYELSAMGSVREGDYVTLLLGKDGAVVGIGRAADLDTVVGGIVLKTGKRVSEEQSSAVLTDYIEVLDTTGTVRQVEHDGRMSYYINQPVEIGYTGGTALITRINQTSMTGRVDAAATAIGGYGIAPGVRIVEYGADGSYAVIDKSRLAGKTLIYGNVLYYHLNAKNEITGMIVKDVTGDNYSYGILLSADEVNEPATEFSAAMLYGTYEVLTAEGRVTYATNDYILGMGGELGPVQIAVGADGKIHSMRRLGSIAVTAVSDYELGAGGTAYPVADGMQVYLKSGNTYYATTLSKVKDLGQYTLLAYYDGSAGKNVRILIAIAK